MTTGVLDQAALATGLKNCFKAQEIPELEVEPARIFVMSGFGQKKLEVWNQVRSHVRLSEECKPIQYPVEAGSYQLLGVYGDDPIRVIGGVQAIVTQSFDGSSITIEATVSESTRIDFTGEIPLVGEFVPGDRDFLDGGISCDRVIRRINGVAGPKINLTAADGVVVENYAEISRIVVNVSGTGLDSCPEFETPGTPECIPNRSEYCGKANSTTNDVCPPGIPDGRTGYKGYTPSSPMAPPRSSEEPVPRYGKDRTGYCLFVRRGNIWDLVSKDLGENYECVTPTFPGYEGQEVYVPGTPIPADPVWIVRNPMFDGEQYWKLIEAEIVPGAFQGINVARVKDGGSISQAVIPITAGSYSVQATVPDNMQSPQILLKTGNGDVLTNEGLSRIDDYVGRTTFHDIPSGTVTLVIEATAGQFDITKIGLIKG